MEKKTSKSYFRIKTTWVAEDEVGNLQKVTTEELVLAENYTEAETMAYAINEKQGRANFGDVNVEIIKTKIDDVLYNNTLSTDSELTNGMACCFFNDESNYDESGIYIIKAVNIVLDEKTGKEKTSNVSFYIPASSNIDANDKITNYLKHTMGSYIVRDIKFDKAEAIYWPQDVLQLKTSENLLQ